MKYEGVSIPLLEGKDLYISNYNLNNGNKEGLSLKNQDGEYVTYRFKGSFDYSLDFIKLKECYERITHSKFSKKVGGFDCCKAIIMVSFDYSIKEYNTIFRKKSKDGDTISLNYMVKLGHNLFENDFDDGVALINGELVGIVEGYKPTIPLDDELLSPYFELKDGRYKVSRNQTVRSTKEVRNILYTNGFTVDGHHYVRWKRSAGSARVGKCMFIDDRVASAMGRWDKAGLKFNKDDAVDLAGLEAYKALTSSSIIGTLKLKPENILVIDDYKSVFNDDVVNVGEENERLTASVEKMKIVNAIWDGQSLIDLSIMGDYQNKGMVLLRNRFFKSCCFNCNIQQWFADNNITEVSQLNGKTTATKIEDVKLITTPSSIKYLKFGTLKKWLKIIFAEDDGTFGVVKYEKPTGIFDNRLVQTHYQLINSCKLSNKDIDNLLKPTFDLINGFKEDSAIFRKWLNINSDSVKYNFFASGQDRSVVIANLIACNSRFDKTEFYRDFRKGYIDCMIAKLRLGKILINGNYSTLCGNPIEMLNFSIGNKVKKTEAKGNVVFSTRFEFGKNIVASRSPHITMSNVWLTQNKYDENIDKYMNHTNEIIYINTIKENVMNRLAGSDFDSDTVMITDNETLVKAAKYNEIFKVAVCSVDGIKTERYNTLEDLADLDDKTSKNVIGEVINLSQQLNTYIWQAFADGKSIDDVQDIYCDVCKLSILSNLCIDMAKREYAIDPYVELSALRDKYNVYDENGRQIKPVFLGYISREKGYGDGGKVYKSYDTSMDYLHKSVSKFIKSKRCTDKLIDFVDTINKEYYDYQDVNYYHASRIISVGDEIYKTVQKYQFKYKDYPKLVDKMRENELKRYRTYIRQKELSISSIIKIFEGLKNQKCSKNYIMFCLIGTLDVDKAKKMFYTDNVRDLYEDENGEISMYGVRFSK